VENNFSLFRVIITPDSGQPDLQKRGNDPHVSGNDFTAEISYSGTIIEAAAKTNSS
jgi:hypothetical protein